MARESERVCVTAKRQNQGVPQEVSVREGSEWCLGMRSCWRCVSTVEATWLSLILSARLSLMRHVRHRPTSDAHRFYYFYCMIILLLWKNSFIWIVNLKQLIDYLLTMGMFTDLTTQLTTQSRGDFYTFSWRQAGLESRGNECKHWSPSARNVLPQSSELDLGASFGC